MVTGRSVITATPPNRFSMVFWAARASAMPPTPNPANMAPVLYPQLLSSAAAVTATMTIFTTREASGKTE